MPQLKASCQFNLLVTALIYAIVCICYTQILDEVLALSRGQKLVNPQPVKKMEEYLREPSDLTNTVYEFRLIFCC